MSNLIPFNDVENMAIVMAKSNLFGMKSPEQACALMLLCQAEGMHPAIAVRDYHIIQGRPALKADAMLARFQQAGGKVQWDVLTDKEVTGTFTHPAGGSATITWTYEMAEKAKLTTKDNWRTYPRAMLRSRVVSEGIRTVFPGVIIGVYTDEETEEFKPPPVKDMGKAEIVDPLPPVDGIPFFLPGGQEPYSWHENNDEWIEEYARWVAKLQTSEKIPDADRQGKIDLLGAANTKHIESMSGLHKAKLKSAIVKAGGQVSPKSESSLLPQESEPSAEQF